MLLVAFSAVDWLALGWLEWNFTFLAAIRASGLVHLSWAAKSTPFKAHRFSHSLVRLVIHRILLGSRNPLYTVAELQRTSN